MNNKKSRIYGRAQRIEFYEKVGYCIIAIVVVALIFWIISNQKGFVDDNVNFAYLKQYMEDNGYICEMIHKNGGSCTLHSDTSTSVFIRYGDGFEFVINSDAYSLDIKHISTEENFSFKTSTSALAGYKSRNYTCETKGNILDELSKCVDENGEELNSNAYIGVIERALKDLNNFIDSSGYSKDALIEDYEWQKN